MRKSVLLLASMGLALLVASGVALAAAGDFDPTFSNNGQVITNLTPDDDYLQDVVVLPSGKIVGAGRAGGGGAVVVRYLPDGSLDTTFGGGDGVATDDRLVEGKAVLVQADGKLVVAGRSFGQDNPPADVALVRFLPNGTLDEGFGDGGDGMVTTTLGENTEGSANALAAQGGKIVVAGYSDSRLDTSEEGELDVALMRYSADGQLDESFGSGGVVKTDLRVDDYADEVAVQRDGKIVVAGTSHAGVFGGAGPRNATNFAVVRYRPGGALDASFGGGDGAVLTNFGDEDHGRGLVLRGGGRVAVAGWTDTRFVDDAIALAAYEPDGSLDKTFGGGDGKVTTPFFHNADDMDCCTFAHDLVRQADGKLVAVGGAKDEFALARYLPSGELDESFGGGDGKVAEDVGYCRRCLNWARAADIQPDGKIVAGGFGGDSIALARYLGE